MSEEFKINDVLYLGDPWGGGGRQVVLNTQQKVDAANYCRKCGTPYLL